MTGPISGRPGQGQGEEIGPVETAQDFPSRPRCDTGDEEGSRRPVDRRCRHRRPHAAPQAQDRQQEAARRFQRARTAPRSPRAGAALRSGGPGRAGLRCPMGRADLMELLVWSFEHVRYLLFKRFPESSPGTSAPTGYVSRALTPEASLDLGSNFIELRLWEIRRPRLGWVCLPTPSRLADRGGVSFAISSRHCGHKIRITGGNSPVLASSIVGW
jgi:hypothetical protein